MENSKQKVHSNPETGKITRNVAGKILERLNAGHHRSPSGRPYTHDMVRNWLYQKSKDPKIETAYLMVVADMNPAKDQQSTEKRKAALMHLDMAERLLSEV